jgi:hypothetical protein
MSKIFQVLGLPEVVGRTEDPEMGDRRRDERRDEALGCEHKTGSGVA